MGSACADRIAGGFVLVRAVDLIGAWRACLGGSPGIGGFRAWLSLREMVARRTGAGADRRPSYGYTEVARLLGVAERTARASVRRLVEAGLVEWADDTIRFPSHGDVGVLDDTISRGDGDVAVPRRLLRHLALGCRPALIATAVAALLRCVSRRRTGFGSWGRLSAAWVAGSFGIDLRRVKQARAELVALGWLAPAASPGWTVNRFGPAWTVDLGWAGPPGGDCHPRPAESGASLPPPESDPDPLSGEKSNPEPAGRGPAGARLGQGCGHPPVAVLGEVTAADDKLPAPTLRDIRPADLADTARVLALHGQAVASGKVAPGEAGRLRFVAAAEHARALGRSNPMGLLARIVSAGLWRVATQDDEDRARRRLREHDRPISAPPPSRAESRPAPSAFRSPYLGAERPVREPTALSALLAQLSAPHILPRPDHQTSVRNGV